MHYNTESMIEKILHDSNLKRIFSQIQDEDTNTSKKESQSNNMNIDKDGFLNMEFDVPGFSKSTITIRSAGNRLFINGDTDNRTLNKEYKIQERWDALNATATVVDGVLTISIPPTIETEAKVKTISVK
jgi:HSP20 family molecular chaperone IbpA